MLEKEIYRLVKNGFEVSFSDYIRRDSLIVRLRKGDKSLRKEVQRINLDCLPYEFAIEQTLWDLERGLLEEAPNG